eukprot:CAMPEP_0119546370 /NCGR_PEP_ID=MMETSP1352-20130426/824_1 /TAXON_ID=265584 /ORGANISM="Stauroneis constricta, Strain CCMP1120" /LENGTH=477 /DNA_ID=CAMNT_0007591073 /DNA_START=124 /DNA_END=1557 /DNA_ORIENTATION=-
MVSSNHHPYRFHHPPQQQSRGNTITDPVLIMKKQRQAKSMMQQANSIIISVNETAARSAPAEIGSAEQHQHLRQLKLAETILNETCVKVGQWWQDYDIQRAVIQYNVQRQQEEEELRQLAIARARRASPHSVQVVNDDAVTNENSHHHDKADALDEMDLPDHNPYGTYLFQAQHRLAQVSLLLGKLEVACNLMLRALQQDSRSFSLSALVMTWYDVALVYLYQGKWQHCQRAINQAMVVMQAKPRSPPTHTIFVPVPDGETSSSPLASSLGIPASPSNAGAGGSPDIRLQVGPDETMTVFLHQVMAKLRELMPGADAGGDFRRSPLARLPWSIQFTTYTTAFGVSTDATPMPLSSILPVQSMPLAAPQQGNDATSTTTSSTSTGASAIDEEYASVTAASLPAIFQTVGGAGLDDDEDDDEDEFDDDFDDMMDEDAFDEEDDDDEATAHRRHHDNNAQSRAKDFCATMDPSNRAAGAA